MINLFEDIENKQTDVSSIINKAKKTKGANLDTEKILKSTALSLQERLAIINEKVLQVLGKQRYDTIVIKDNNTFTKYVDAAIASGRIDIDTETNNSTDPITCKIMGLCLYYPGGKHAYIPVNHTDFDDNRLPWQLSELDCKVQLERILDSKIKIIMHNGKFDYEVIKCTCGIEVPPYWDTLVAARLIDENKYSEKRTSLKWLYINLIDPSQEKYSIDKLFENIPYQYVDPEIFALYAATDAFMTDKLFEWEEPLIESQCPHFDKYDREIKGVAWLFHEVEMPIVQVTAEMELIGVEVDEELGARLKEKYNQLLANIDSKIDEIIKELEPVAKAWSITKEAQAPVKIFMPKKSKTDAAKLEAMYNKVDLETGERYKEGKKLADQLVWDTNGHLDFNLASPSQLAVLFYNILCVPKMDTLSRKTGKDELKYIKEQLSSYLSEEELDLIDALDLDEEEDESEDDIKYYAEAITAASEDEKDKIEHFKLQRAAKLCSLILERRGYAKLITTYIDTIPELAKHWPDGRIRFRLNSTGTDTGRYSSGGKWHWMERGEDGQLHDVITSGINIQNIPSRGDGKITRMLFKAKNKESRVFLTDNFYQIRNIDEIETTNGWKYGKDLVVGDALVSDDGYDTILQIEFDGKNYKLFVSNN